jgi:hypothetical protein
MEETILELGKALHLHYGRPRIGNSPGLEIRQDWKCLHFGRPRIGNSPGLEMRLDQDCDRDVSASDVHHLQSSSKRLMLFFALCARYRPTFSTDT